MSSGRGNTDVIGNSIAGSVPVILNKLATRGWITLRQMGPLLGYGHPTAIYGRQKTKNPIPTIQIGCTHRVYADIVIETLNNSPPEDQEASQTMLRIYRGFKQDKEEQQDE